MRLQEPADVLEQLNRFDDPDASMLQTAVFLATPSFTHWLDIDNDFLTKAVHQLFSHQVDGASKVRTISAIVDRVPSDSKPRMEDAGVGNEGISILLTYQAVRSSPAGSDTAEAAPKKSYVRFVSEASKKEQCVALPLANTLFYNGHHSTSFEDLWQRNYLQEIGIRFDRTSRVPLKSFDIPTSKLQNPFFLGIPMVPLTPPREVASSMGNVIRELKRGDTGEPFPASTELEAAVSKLLSSSWLTDAARNCFTVFALTTRKDFYDGAKSQIRTGIWPPVRKQVLQGLLQGQARMSRVTGGGGGWGNKKGLLSLEPGDNLFDSQYSQQLPLPQEGEAYNLESTFSVVSPRDNVQFFAIFPGTQRSPKQKYRPLDWVMERNAEEEVRFGDESYLRDRFPRIVIGTNPPEDQYPATPIDVTQSGDILRFLPHCFGMFSQGGACLGRANDKTGSTIFTSRLDIPYTNIVVEARSDFREAGTVVRYILPSDADGSGIPESKKN
jgi:hypothetical protein